MSSIVPGADALLLSASAWRLGDDLTQMENRIGGMIGPRRISQSAGQADPNIRINHIPLNIGHLFGVQHGSAIEVTSPPIERYQLMIPLRGWLTSRPDLVAMPGMALVYAPQARLDTQWSADCVALILSLSAEMLKSMAFKVFPGLGLDQMPRRSLIGMTAGAGQSLANVLGMICQESEMTGSAFGCGITKPSLEEVVLLSLLLAFSEVAPSFETQNVLCHNRETHLNRALDYIEAHLADPITMTALAREAGVSVRTLQYCFLECFGVGPMTYLTRRRIRAVHDSLRHADPATCVIGDVAAQWGFYNGSSFARIYHRTVGELPSETLARRAAGRGRLAVAETGKRQTRAGC